MRHTLAHLEESKIREVANAGMGRPDVLAFWFGESDEATPDVVNEAAIASLRAGETFYSHNLGLPALREAIAAYMARLHGPAIDTGRIAVTSGGVSGLMLAVQALVDPGDEVVAVTPRLAQPRGAAAHPGCAPAVPAAAPRGDGAWTLDMDALKRAVTPATRLLVVNAPNNPTGWTLSAAEQREILAHCRATGTWILADEVYERLYYEPTPHGCAPSFLDLAVPEDRLVVVHSFSKSFLMTGWRLGWLVLPPALAAHMGKLIEFNTSCVSVFTQRGGIAALQHEAEIVPRVTAHMHLCRDTLLPLLQAVPGVRAHAASGGMYAFFRMDGHGDAMATAKRLVAEAGLGLAPGNAFGPEGAGWLRWCFASRDPARLVEGVARLRKWLEKAGAL
ncbi:pyridoxal phosphate-dependent aminotransferase [Paracidovorax cattleyae]|uniref:pyridoxal phosphate-dependent aminotransferase n=1 Tax=Paracidovorax cattleyae TaxID=80868 RepID=UPI0018AFF836|nr:pyridoxal phosphate-dependent aminotransferase [Paracidovorax cattleyae]MBF9265082.1 pyridoxal phosphate-dependent aminotransferase [Paracidovorax cattleyae]